jgi:DNA-binding MarR family transcriptional regulator
MADGSGGHCDAAFAHRGQRFGEISIHRRLAGPQNDGGLHGGFPFAYPNYVYYAHIWEGMMPSRKKVHNTHIGDALRQLHGALLDIISVVNRPQRDEVLIKEAGIPLDRALFPLLVLVERFGPIGVVELADRVGRDYTTVSRQVAKLESLDLVQRRDSVRDRRVREAVVTPKGKAMTDLVDAARERIGREIFESWDAPDIDELVRLMRKFADAVSGELPAGS